MFQLPTALITGGTSGLGLEIADIHRRRGHRIIIIGRVAENTLPTWVRDHNQTVYIRSDLSSSTADRTIGTRMARGGHRLDYVYFNAASGYWGDFSAQPRDQIESLLAVTLLSPILLLQALDRFINPGASVKVISSVVRYWPRPHYALYAAAKAALSNAMRSIAFERSTPYAIRVIHPGAMATGFHRKSGMSDRPIRAAASPRRVARIVVRPLGSVIGFGNRLLCICGSVRMMLAVIGGRRRAGASPARGGDETVMIIGAAEGIGFAIARQYRARNTRLILVDHNRPLLEKNYAADARHGTAPIRYIIADIQLPADRKRIEQCIATTKNITRIFITAAVSAVGPFATTPRHALLRVYAVNCLATVQLVQAIARTGTRSGAPDGRTMPTVILFSSLAAFVHYPGAAMYAATKACAATLAAALRHNRAVVLATVFPGPVATRHAMRYSPDNTRAAQRMSAAVAACKIIKQMQSSKTVLFLRFIDRVIAVAAIALPRLFGMIMRRTIYRAVTTPLLPPPPTASSKRSLNAQVPPASRL